jgi:hypothetical protein
MQHRRFVLTVLLATMLGATMASPAMAVEPTTTLVSVQSNGDPANGDSGDATISDGGRYVAFESDANNLSDRDDNAYRNVFVHDRRTGRTRLGSIRSNGGAANGESGDPEISGNGRYVCFESDANNLSSRDDNAYRNVFVHERLTGVTRLVSIASNGDDAEQESGDCSISDSGRYVAFESQADNLAPGSGDDAYWNIFVHDRETGRTRLVSKTSAGDPGDGNSGEAALSGDGMRVAFDSEAGNLSNEDTAFVGIFVHDRRTGRTRLASRASNGDAADDESYDPAMSNGRFVAFESYAQNLSGVDDNNDLDIYVHDLGTGRTRLASKRTDGEVANGFSTNPGLSGNGRFVVFRSDANNLSNLDNNDYDNIFGHDRETGRTRPVSLRSDGAPANDDSSNPEPSAHRTISERGTTVVFESDANNLSFQDENDYRNVFVRGPLT